MRGRITAMLLMACTLLHAGPGAAAEIDKCEAGAITAPDYGAPITFEQARTMAAAARQEAQRLGFSGFTLAITGPDGSLVLFERLDGTTYVSVQFAMAKARTAAISRRVTGPGPDGSMTVPMPDLIALPGGFPIVVNGKTIGGIGISGTTGGDVAIAKAALASLQGH